MKMGLCRGGRSADGFLDVRLKGVGKLAYVNTNLRYPNDEYIFPSN